MQVVSSVLLVCLLLRFSICLQLPKRPPPMAPSQYEWKRLLEEAERYEAVAKELKRRGQELRKRRYVALSLPPKLMDIGKMSGRVATSG